MKNPASRQGFSIGFSTTLAVVLAPTLLLLAGLLLATLLATLLPALLLLAGLLVGILILIHHSFPLQRWSKRHSIQFAPRGQRQCTNRRIVPVRFPLDQKSRLELPHHPMCSLLQKEASTMGRYLLLWLLGVPIPILVLIWLFGGLH